MTATTRSHRQPDYWCDQRLLITVDGPDSRQRFEVDKPFARLGSHKLSEVLIPDKAIARRRLYFHATDDGVFCVDLTHPKSTASNFCGWLAPDNTIELGPYRVSAQLSDPASREAQPPAEVLDDLQTKDTAAEPVPVLAMSLKGKEIARRELTRRLTLLGRRDPSTLRITSHSVSASHCILYWDSGVLWVVDLFSGNGTLLEGRPIEADRFSPGDSLKIGRAELYHLATSQAARCPHLDEPAEVSYPADRDAHVTDDAVDDGLGSEIEVGDSSPHMAEAAALADRLDAQRAEFDAEVADWTNRRQADDDEFAERLERLSTDRAELDGRKAQWEESRRQQEAQLASRRKELDQVAAAVENEKKDLAALREQAEVQRRLAETAVAGEVEQRESIDELRAQVENSRRQFEEEADAWRAEQSQRETEHRQEVAELAGRWEALLAQQKDAAEVQNKLSQDRQDLERQVSELAAAREEFAREKEAREADLLQTENSFDERSKKLEAAFSLLAADRDELDSLRENGENELRLNEERLADLSRQLDDRQTDLQRRKEAWEEKQHQDEDSLADRSAELERATAALSEDRARLSEEVSAKEADLERSREASNAKRQQEAEAAAARAKELDEAAAALADERRKVAETREDWEAKRRRLEDEYAHRAQELKRQQVEFFEQRREWESRLRQQAAQSQLQPATVGPVNSPALGTPNPVDTGASRRVAGPRGEPPQPGSMQPSPEAASSEPSALVDQDGRPRPAALLATIRRGPQWTSAMRNNELRATSLAYWAGAVLVAAICSALSGAAVWLYLTPSHTITIQASESVGKTLAVMPSETLTKFIKSDEVFDAASKSIGAPMPSGSTRPNVTAARLVRRLIVDYSEKTGCLELGLRSSKVAESRVSLEAIGEAVLAQMSDLEDGADSSHSTKSDPQTFENAQRLPWTIAAIVLGFLVSIVVAFVWARHRSARNRLPYGLA